MTNTTPASPRPFDRHVVFLLGSGASRPAGMPMVSDITKRLFAIEQYVSDFDQKLRQLVQHVFERCLPVFERYQPARQPNYEDVAYVVRQVADHVIREHENPAILPFVDEIKAVLGTTDIGLVYKYCDETVGRIRQIVASMLSAPQSSNDHLGCLVGLCRQPGVRVTIATLNHDRVVDVVLARAGIDFHDGFVGPNGDIFKFADSFPDDDSPHLLKLHGSIDWFRYQVPDPGGPGKHSIFVRSPNPDKEHLLDGAGNALGYTADPNPQILVGSFSKILDYTNYVFDDLHARLHQEMKRSDRLVIIGYGGQDKAVNSRIIHWMDESKSRRLTLVDPNPDNVLKLGRPAIQVNLGYWKKTGRVRVIPKGVEGVTCEELATW